MAGVPPVLYVGIGLSIVLALSFILWRRLRRRPTPSKDSPLRPPPAPSGRTRPLLERGAAARRNLMSALAALPNPFAPRITLLVDVDKQELASGDRLGVGVTVRANRKTSLRRLTVEMVYAGVHRRQEDGMFGAGDARFESEHLRYSRLLAENVVVYWMTDTFRAHFDLDPDTPPSYKGRRMDLHWFIRAVAEPAWGSPVRSAEVPVALHPANGKAPPPPPGGPRSTTSSYDDCELSLFLPQSRVDAGQTLSGVLEVRPRRDFTATRVEAMLAWSEGLVILTYGRVIGIEERQELAGRTVFMGSGIRRFPVRFTIPPTTMPSIELPVPLHIWTLRSSLWLGPNQVRDVEMPIYIHNPNPSSHPGPAATSASPRRSIWARAARLAFPPLRP